MKIINITSDPNRLLDEDEALFNTRRITIMETTNNTELKRAYALIKAATAVQVAAFEIIDDAIPPSTVILALEKAI